MNRHTSEAIFGAAGFIAAGVAAAFGHDNSAYIIAVCTVIALLFA